MFGRPQVACISLAETGWRVDKQGISDAGAMQVQSLCRRQTQPADSQGPCLCSLAASRKPLQTVCGKVGFLLTKLDSVIQGFVVGLISICAGVAASSWPRTALVALHGV